MLKSSMSSPWGILKESESQPLSQRSGSSLLKSRASRLRLPSTSYSYYQWPSLLISPRTKVTQTDFVFGGNRTKRKKKAIIKKNNDAVSKLGWAKTTIFWYSTKVAFSSAWGHRTDGGLSNSRQVELG